MPMVVLLAVPMAAPVAVPVALPMALPMAAPMAVPVAVPMALHIRTADLVCYLSPEAHDPDSNFRQCDGLTWSPGKSQSEGQEDQGTNK